MMKWSAMPHAALVACVLSSSLSAYAQGDGGETKAAASEEADKKARDEAAQRFQKGVAFYNEGDFQLALIEFERAHQLVPDYRVLYNIGQVAIQLGKFARARIALETYLQLGQGQLDPTRLAGVEKDLDMLRGRTAYLEILGAPDGSEVFVDDLPQGVTPLEGPLLLDAGQHRLIVRKPQHEEFTRWLTLAGAERMEMTATLEPQVVAPALGTDRRPDPVTPNRSAEPPSRPWVTVGWVATGSLAAGAIATGVTGLIAAQELSRLKSSPNPQASVLEQKSSEAAAWFLATDILGGAALVTGGVTLYFTLARDTGAAAASTTGMNAKRQLALHLNPRSVLLSGTF